MRNAGLRTPAGLCKAYAECDKPFVEMGKYGKQIKAADYAYIEQSDRLDFSIEFNAESDRITIFDGKNIKCMELHSVLSAGNTNKGKNLLREEREH